MEAFNAMMTSAASVALHVGLSTGAVAVVCRWLKWSPVNVQLVVNDKRPIVVTRGEDDEP